MLQPQEFSFQSTNNIRSVPKPPAPICAEYRAGRSAPNHRPKSATAAGVKRSGRLAVPVERGVIQSSSGRWRLYRQGFPRNTSNQLPSDQNSGGARILYMLYSVNYTMST